MVVAPIEPGHLDAAERLLESELGGRIQARLGELVDVLDGPVLGAWEEDALAGVASYLVSAGTAELRALCVRPERRRRGTATRLVHAVIDETATAGVRDLWLVTTNDNIAALGLYQRLGFRVSEVRLGAVDAARELKPSIPAVGASGIPIHDEIVLRLGP